MASSPGESAGLQPGDQIINYNGQRIFSTWELSQQTMAGGGEGTVVIDLLRDGAPLQIVLPRGPIGVQVGRSRGQ
jgi:S1-C subfamily serine protease